jgi:signal transduction histidine kinase/ActR/RegA family two-component response regulator/CHASE3 domain sensor protein
MKKIQTRLILSFFVIIILLVLQGIAAYQNIQSISSTQKNAYKKRLQIEHDQHRIAGTRLIVFKILGTMNPGQMDIFHEQFINERAYLKKELIDRGIEKAVVDTYFDLYHKIIELQYDFRPRTAYKLINQESKKLHDDLVNKLESISELVQSQSEQTISNTYQKALLIIFSLLIAALVIAFLLAFILARTLTDRQQAEKELNQAHERILTILDSIDSTVYVADMDTYEILFMNKRMITDFGGDKTGDICYSAFRENSEPCECCTNNQLINKDGKPAGVRIWDDKNPVTGKYYINYDRAIEWTDGHLVRMQIATDITELKRMETQLNQAQKMESVGRLAGGVAHDFNNMLGVILGHTELALLKTDEDHDLVSDLNEIQKAAKRSADITKQLLAFARKQTISPRQLDLNDTVEKMLTMLRRLIGEDIDLVWQPGAHLWPMKMDPTQIDQILANLCVNARDAISGVGKLTIETGKKTFDEAYCKEHAGFIPGDFVLLAVSDNGCGMDKGTLENLYEPFFTTKDVGKGTGLGLATVYGIVKQNNGFINVYSEPGQGSTFKIYLPRLVAEEGVEKSVLEKKVAAGGTETILLVEDEPTILRMTRMMLERKGYSVLSAATPVNAVDLAKTHADKIHLLMTDVVMPEMNGRDLSGQITALYPDIRLLFMSGYTSNVIAHQGVLDDGVAFIQKPFSMADMTVKVREVLDTAPDKNQG